MTSERTVVMNHETVESISKRKKPFTVDYTGFGWVMIQNGVFEDTKIQVSMVCTKMQVFESGAVQDMCGEDVSFCLDAIEAGYEIWKALRIRGFTKKLALSEVLKLWQCVQRLDC